MIQQFFFATRTYAVAAARLPAALVKKKPPRQGISEFLKILARLFKNPRRILKEFCPKL